MTPEHKTCSACHESKPVESFHQDLQRGGWRTTCKTCAKQKQRVWDAARYERMKRENPELLKIRSLLGRQKRTEKHEKLGDTWVLYFIQSLKKRHTLSLGDYYQLFEQQRGNCALCLYPVNWQFKGFHVDHDHACTAHRKGQISCKLCIRGLLCNDCNRQHLPWAEKDVALQGSRVVEYLMRRPFVQQAIQ